MLHSHSESEETFGFAKILNDNTKINDTDTDAALYCTSTEYTIIKFHCVAEYFVSSNN